jgi:hypothetical protein
VRSIWLDSWAAERGIVRVDVLKIDLEGAERLVLEGDRDLIAACKPLILCEAADRDPDVVSSAPRNLIRLLEQLDIAYIGSKASVRRRLWPEQMGRHR